MNIDIRRQTLDLADEGLLAIRDGRTSRIISLEGTLWITEEGEVKDTILRQGDTYTIRNAGLVVVTSLGASRITLEESQARPYAARRQANGDLPELAACA